MKAANKISKLTGLETRETVLGYIQRGGIPTPMDRILATRYGACAAEPMAKEKFGNMVALQQSGIVSIPLNEVSDKVRTVPADHPLIARARNLGTCFGDRLFSRMD
jgi:6-phosphofructokinase 1